MSGELSEKDKHRKFMEAKLAEIREENLRPRDAPAVEQRPVVSSGNGDEDPKWRREGQLRDEWRTMCGVGQVIWGMPAIGKGGSYLVYKVDAEDNVMSGTMRVMASRAALDEFIAANLPAEQWQFTERSRSVYK